MVIGVTVNIFVNGQLVSWVEFGVFLCFVSFSFSFSFVFSFIYFSFHSLWDLFYK